LNFFVRLEDTEDYACISGEHTTTHGIIPRKNLLFPQEHKRYFLSVIMAPLCALQRLQMASSASSSRRMFQLAREKIPVFSTIDGPVGASVWASPPLSVRYSTWRSFASTSKGEVPHIDVAEVRKLFYLWNDALATLDPTAVAARYTKGAILLPTISGT
jgi:hypothetical protein